MEYRPLGRSGITVSHLTLGAMMLGSMGNADRDECVRIVRQALDAGVTSINTADGYSAGQSEQIIGEALTGRSRGDVVLSVKTGVVPGGRPNQGGGSRRWFTQAIEGSLRRLKTDYIDVYELGAPDPLTDIDETLAVLTDLATAGKVRSFGTSKMPPSQIAEARAVAERRGHGVFRTEETPYSIVNRSAEYDLFPTCERFGIGVLAFGVLAGGWLSGRYRAGQPVAVSGPRSHRPGMDAAAPGNATKLVAAHQIGDLAAEHGLTPVQLATAWAACHPAVSSVVIGPRTLGQLDGYLAAADTSLSGEVLDRVDEVVARAVTLDPTDTMWAYGTRALDTDRRRR